MRVGNFFRTVLALAAVLSVSAVISPTSSYALEAEETIDIGVDEHLGAQLPLDITFTTYLGEVVRLGDYFDAKRPVMLVPVYYNCPRICGYILQGILGVLQSTSRNWLGRDFQIVTFAIGPEDSPADAKKRATKLKYKIAKGTHDADAWHFITGTQASIQTLTRTLGYRFTKDGDDYAHPAAIMVATPEGQIARYLYGLTFPSQDVELALTEARSGTIKDRVVDRILLYCYKYDPAAKEYVLVAQNIMQVGGYITLFVVGTFMATMLWGDRKRRQASSEE